MIRVYSDEPHPDHVLVPLDYEPREETEFAPPKPAWPMNLVPLIVLFGCIGAGVAAFLHWLGGMPWIAAMILGWIWAIPFIIGGGLRGQKDQHPEPNLLPPQYRW